MPTLPSAAENALTELKPGDTAKIGAKSYALSNNGSGVVVQQVGVVRKTFEIGDLLAKHGELSK